ncbi:MAG TPA: hypothetical protein VHP14_25470 [Anaerolineales bacterium]|nr:hypothetical protein [Anaerolineales bacterium]
MSEKRFKPSDHPFVILITVLAGLITIVIFASGIQNLPDLYRRVFQSDLYDNFEDTFYDGKVNPSLWEIDGNARGEATQLNGALIIQTNSKEEDGNFALYLVNPRTISYQNLKYVEAKFKLDSREAGNGSFLKTQAITFLDQKVWWIECKFTNGTIAYPDASCNLQEGAFLSDGSPLYSYETEHIPCQYDTWYTIRFVSDPDTGKVSFYLDNKLFGEGTFSNVAAMRNLSGFSLQVGSWMSPADNMLGYVDDVKVGTAK